MSACPLTERPSFREPDALSTRRTWVVATPAFAGPLQCCWAVATAQRGRTPRLLLTIAAVRYRGSTYIAQGVSLRSSNPHGSLGLRGRHRAASVTLRGAGWRGPVLRVGGGRLEGAGATVTV